MRKQVFLAVGLVALAGIGWFGVHWYTEGRFQESTDNAYVQGDIAAIAPKIAGYVRQVAVRDNQKVAQGEILATLDDADYSAQVAQAEAQLQAAVAAIGSADANLTLQGSTIAQAQSGVVSADADLKRTLLDQQRYAQLAPEGFASRQRLELANADRQKAEAALSRARATLQTEQDRTGVLEAARRQADAQRAQAEAQLSLRRIDLENTVIRAPFAGTVGNKGVETGQYVRAGTQLLSLVPEQVFVVANFKETQIARMRPGQPVELHVDAMSSQTVHGRIESLAPASGSQFALLPPENATGNFTKIVQRVPVRIAVSGDGEGGRWLRPGLSVTASVDTRDAGQRNADARGAYVPAALQAEAKPVR